MTRITPDAPGFPERLAELPQPPGALHIRPPADAVSLARAAAPPVVAIVGARCASQAACAFTRRLARGVAAAGVGVVSGLARGIDAAAHEGALDAGGRTVAVLGCGIERDYPRGNAPLAARVAQAGAVISEYPPGTPPAPWRFPARNRIVAALADVVVVVEAARTSGALITAGFALELGREVLVVPACPWIAAAAGGNALLRDGAMPVTCAEDVLVALAIDPARASQVPEHVLGGDAGRVLAAVRRAPATPESLAVRLGLEAGRLSRALTELELAGAIVRERDGSIVGA